MNLVDIARIYTDLVQAHDQIPDSEHIAKEEIGALRTKYHQMLMDKLTEEGIPFGDRFEAMHMAFQIVKSGTSSVLSVNESRRTDYQA